MSFDLQVLAPVNGIDFFPASLKELVSIETYLRVAPFFMGNHKMQILERKVNNWVYSLRRWTSRTLCTKLLKTEDYNFPK